jgi:hypothetical protein
MRTLYTLSQNTNLSSYLSIPVAPTWSIGNQWNQLQFLNLRQSVGLLWRGFSTTQGRYLYRTTQTPNKRRETSMPWEGFEHTIPVFERAKTFHALDRAATVIGQNTNNEHNLLLGYVQFYTIYTGPVLILACWPTAHFASRYERLVWMELCLLCFLCMASLCSVLLAFKFWRFWMNYVYVIYLCNYRRKMFWMAHAKLGQCAPITVSTSLRTLFCRWVSTAASQVGQA